MLTGRLLRPTTRRGRSRQRAAPLRRALRRAGVAPGGDRGDAHPRRPVHHGAHDRRSAGAGARCRARTATAIPSTCSARRRARWPMPRATAPPIDARSPRSARRRPAGRSRRRPGSRSSCRRCTRATRWRSASGSCASCLPSLLGLAGEARAAGIGFTIDAEEADRLELSLDLVEALALAPDLAGWDGLGLAVQAYQKRALAVIDWLADLAGAGAAPADGAPRQGRLLGQRDQAGAGARPRRLPGLHPQGRDRRLLSRLRQAACSPPATPSIRNSRRTTPIPSPPSSNWPGGRQRDWEFQRLHGMGEALYAEVVGAAQDEPAVPRLCAGRQPRGSARLSRAPAAGKRRQHLVRQPHRRRERADRRHRRRPGRAAGGACR